MTPFERLLENLGEIFSFNSSGEILETLLFVGVIILVFCMRKEYGSILKSFINIILIILILHFMLQYKILFVIFGIGLFVIWQPRISFWVFIIGSVGYLLLSMISNLL